MKRITFVALILFCASLSADAMLQTIVGGNTSTPSTPPLTISCAGSGSTSSTIACTLTYTGTAPTSATGAWNTTCSGSSTITSFTASAGAGSFTASTPASACAGTLTVTDNRAEVATSGSVTISAPGPWTLKASTKLTATSPTGGTTPNIDCTGANLIVIAAPYYPASGISVSDSSSNTFVPVWAGGTSGGLVSGSVQFYAVINPTVTASQNFTVSGVGVFPAMFVECWIDSSGTPTYDSAAQQNNGTASSVSTITAGSSAYVSSVSNTLIFAGIGTVGGTAGATFSIDTGFNNPPDQTALAPGNNAGGALSYFIQPSAGSVNPTWSISSPAPPSTGLFGFKP